MSAVRLETKLWVWQRMSAALLAICVVVHLGTIIYAVQSGLSASEIISRVSGSLTWFLFYSVFVIATAVHAPIGIRTLLKETTALSTKSVHLVMAMFCLIIMTMGFRAIVGLFSAG